MAASHAVPFKQRRCTMERIEKMLSTNYFTDVNLSGRTYPKRAPVTLTHFAVSLTFCLPSFLSPHLERLIKQAALNRELDKRNISLSCGLLPDGTELFSRSLAAVGAGPHSSARGSEGDFCASECGQVVGPCLVDALVLVSKQRKTFCFFVC